MLGTGLEPARLTARASKTRMSAIPSPEREKVRRQKEEGKIRNYRRKTAPPDFFILPSAFLLYLHRRQKLRLTPRLRRRFKIRSQRQKFRIAPGPADERQIH